MGLPERHEVRVGDDDRQVVVDQLRIHVGAGRLTMEEFEERTGAALAARTVGELVRVTSDLPPVRTSATKGPPIRVQPKAQRSPWDKAYRAHIGIWGVLVVFFMFITALTPMTVTAWLVVSAAIGLTVGIHGVVKKAAES